MNRVMCLIAVIALSSSGCSDLEPCPEGFAGAGDTCFDIDECYQDNGGCDPRATCTNTPGARICGTCPVGYGGTGETGCIDVDECLANNGGCDPLTTCTNTEGARTCGTCPSGYGGSGEVGCFDIDECLANNGGCDPLTKCSNVAGSRVCGACPDGYTGTGEAGCVDVDECLTNHGECDLLASCTNIPGGRTCGACPNGYAGTGETGCVDIDECLENNGDCDPLASCTNSGGGRTCGACPGGYTGTGETGCIDIDECLENNGGCLSDEICVNIGGGRNCHEDYEWANWTLPADAPPPDSYAAELELVRDNVTGLVWQRYPPAESFDWDGAKRYCETLVLAGYDDWCLPTAIELITIIDYGRANPAINPTAFPGTASDYFWSSSLTFSEGYQPKPSSAVIVDFAAGRTRWVGLGFSYALRCVR